MTQETFSVRSHHGSKSPRSRKSCRSDLHCMRLFAILAVTSITLYMIFSGTPALFKVGILDILFRYFYGSRLLQHQALVSFICYPTSIVGTFLAILIGVPVGVMTAVFLER